MPVEIPSLRTDINYQTRFSPAGAMKFSMQCGCSVPDWLSISYDRHWQLYMAIHNHLFNFDIFLDSITHKENKGIFFKYVTLYLLNRMTWQQIEAKVALIVLEKNS